MTGPQQSEIAVLDRRAGAAMDGPVLVDVNAPNGRTLGLGRLGPNSRQRNGR